MDSVPLLDLRPQYEALRQAIDQAIQRVVASQRFILGPEVEAFERELATYVGVPQAVGCASGTDALILALAALGVGPGDEVLTAPFSFFASASCACRVGARPRFVDIDPATFNLDPSKLEEAITPKTRAIIPVHLFGQCAAMDSILEIAERHGLPVVEDAAQALGARYRSERCGGWLRAGAMGACGAYSFFPAKNLGGYGDGGACVTADPELAQRLRILRVHGQREPYDHVSVGWNSRLDEIQAAVLRVKLPYLDVWCRQRAVRADRYDRWFRQAGLVDAGAIEPPVRDPRCEHIFHQYTLRAQRRDALREHLEREGVGHAVYYPVPLHLQRCFRDLGYREGDFPEAERAAREVISLPVFPDLTREQQERVVSAVARFYGRG